MYLAGLPPVKAGTIQDRLRISVWYRREQAHIFEVLLPVFAAGIPVNADIIKKVENMINSYMEIVIPGTAEFKKMEQNTFIKKQSNALHSIYDLLKKHNGKLERRTAKI